ncbi:hypothetical protein [uncultured Roseobacter sp.]|uniref:NfeD family protein n=1 Tax=uncultured Roseobacter sp. TaxID=114847 RepID=UPI002636061F|nr:hypothetical protein [uncultured Roseobacter sp.]
MISAFLGIWWLWIAVAIVLAIIEVFAPGFIFLGFAIGALITAGFVGFGFIPSAAMLMAVFAGVSLLAWIGLRLAFRSQSSGAKVITRDINED